MQFLSAVGLFGSSKVNSVILWKTVCKSNWNRLRIVCIPEKQPLINVFCLRIGLFRKFCFHKWQLVSYRRKCVPIYSRAKNECCFLMRVKLQQLLQKFFCHHIAMHNCWSLAYGISVGKAALPRVVFSAVFQWATKIVQIVHTDMNLSLYQEVDMLIILVWKEKF